MKKSSRFKRRFACVVAAAFLFAGAFFAPRAEIAASAETFAAETIAQPIQGEGPPTIPGKEGDTYFDNTNKQLYRFEGGKWVTADHMSGKQTDGFMIGAIVVGVFVLFAAIAIPAVYYATKKRR